MQWLLHYSKPTSLQGHLALLQAHFSPRPLTCVILASLQGHLPVPFSLSLTCVNSIADDIILTDLFKTRNIKVNYTFSFCLTCVNAIANIMLTDLFKACKIKVNYTQSDIPSFHIYACKLFKQFLNLSDKRLLRNAFPIPFKFQSS